MENEKTKIQMLRDQLKEISLIAKDLFEADLKTFDGVDIAKLEELTNLTMNKKIIKYIYKEPIFTFKQWKEKGYSVKKGQHAKLLWGKPLILVDENGELIKKQVAKNEEANTDNIFMYPIIFVFGESQVQQNNFYQIKSKQKTEPESEYELLNI